MGATNQHTSQQPGQGVQGPARSPGATGPKNWRRRKRWEVAAWREASRARLWASRQRPSRCPRARRSTDSGFLHTPALCLGAASGRWSPLAPMQGRPRRQIINTPGSKRSQGPAGALEKSWVRHPVRGNSEARSRRLGAPAGSGSHPPRWSSAHWHTPYQLPALPHVASTAPPSLQ